MSELNISRAFSRRAFLAGGIGAGVAAALAGCSFAQGGGGNAGAAGTETLKFWDMPWAGPGYTSLGKSITSGYKPANGLPKVSYQTIQWNNFYQTFASAIASKTNPAASTGGAFQALQFAQQGAIHMADNLVAKFKKDGLYDDFLPGLIDSLKTPAGYVAVPWALDIRPMWYRKDVFEKAGVAAPTDWDSWLTAAAALKKIGSYAFAVGAGQNNQIGNHVMVSLMIQNGGGLFNAHGEVDVVTDRNIETMTFVQEMVAKGYTDPASVSYTSNNTQAQWRSGKFAYGFDELGLDMAIGGDAGKNIVVAPLVYGPHKTTGTLQFVNNVMMYKNNSSDAGTEAFVEYYVKNVHAYWDKNQIGALPALHSISKSEAFQSQKSFADAQKIWQPVARQYSQLSPHVFAGLAAVDGGAALNQFTQTMLSGQTTPKAALTTLQAGIQSVIK